MRVRERAWIEKSPNLGIYYVKTNSGAISYYSNYKDAMSYVNHINNEDSEGYYFDDGRPTKEEEEMKERKWQKQMARNARLEAQAKRSAERKEKEQKKVEENRKSKRSDEKYVYVISLIQRGKKYTEYFKGETNLLKMDSFTAYKETDAKVFNTKASAQKVVDALSKNFMVRKLYRNLKVVQKKRELFEGLSVK